MMSWALAENKHAMASEAQNCYIFNRRFLMILKVIIMQSNSRKILPALIIAASALTAQASTAAPQNAAQTTMQYAKARADEAPFGAKGVIVGASALVLSTIATAVALYNSKKPNSPAPVSQRPVLQPRMRRSANDPKNI